MPLWSNEEWRARIGSCWCALGRPFTSSESANRRSYDSDCLVLSGRSMLQAVYVLIASMALLVVQGSEVINGFVSGCRKLLKNNFHPRGVLMIFILLLQATCFIQSSLLLRCGDIESNPGPGIYPDLDYDDVDNSTVLTEDDFREVYREVVNIQSNYYQFGIDLGLPLREMDAVRQAFRQDIPQAFTEVLRVFLKHRYNFEKYGPPTWRKLVETVDSPAGGNSHALAKKIAEQHPVIKGGGNDDARVTDNLPSAADETPAAMAETIPQHHPQAKDRDQDYNKAKVLIIGTHKDKETDKESPGAEETPVDETATAMAETIPKHHPQAKDQESEINPTLREAFRATISIAAKWQNIGTLLEIPIGTLDTIQRDQGGSGAVSCLREMLTEWLKRVDPPPTWSELAEAVELFHESKAEDIRTKFCQT